MSAERIVHRLLDGIDDPTAIGPLPDYVAPGALHTNVKDILDHAQFLKEQAQQAGALDVIHKMYGQSKPEFSMRDIDRAFLLLAVEELNEEVQPPKIARRLKQLMHSVWS